MLRAWFFNVGHGDCTLIEHPSGNLTLIDINTSGDYDGDSYADLVAERRANNALAQPFGTGPLAELMEAGAALNAAREELTDPIEFLKQKFPGREIFRFILTHPDLDHMRGIKRLFTEIGVVNFWDTDNTKPAPAFRCEDDRVDWEFYQYLRTGRSGSIRLVLNQGHQAPFINQNWDNSPGGDGIEILSPFPGLTTHCNEKKKSNDLSIVIRVRYGHHSILLPGDAEEIAWGCMVGTYGNRLKSTVLKASHHGRDSGFHLEAVQKIAPEWTVVSVGRKPSTDASHKYRYHAGRAISTRYHGNIHITLDGLQQVSVMVDRNADR